MDTDEVGAAFATTPWQECALHFDDWIALVKERNELRSKLSAYDEAKLLALDLNFLKQNWEKAQSTWFLPKMLNTRSVKSQLKKALLEKTKTNNGTMGEIVVAAIRMREINLKLTSIYAQAEALLGKSWRGGEPDSAQLEKIRLWGENLHNQLGKLAEGEASWLLAMRNLLSECFKAGPGIFAKGAPDGERLVALRDAVTTFEAAAIGFMEEANIDRASLDAAQDHPTAVSAMLDIFLHAALRIRKINSDFTSIYVRAEALLGKSWRGGEPDSAQLEKIRLWGENLHDQLGKLAEGNESWLSTIGNLLSECFKAGPGIFAKGTPDGDYLIALRDAVATFEDSSLAFMEEAKIDRTALDGADDYLTAVSVMLDILLQAAPRIREINRTLASEAATAQECLGVLWAKGEPNPDTLEQALHWGEFLHSRLLAFADEDLGWLGSFRQQLSELFTEGPSAYGPETNTVIRMARFREQWAGFNQTLERYLQELRLRRGLIDESSDHFSATLTLAERIAGSWEKIREWCSWQKVRHQALGFGMSPVVELLESSHGTTIEVPALFERSFRRKLLFTIMEQEDSLREFFGNEHNERIARFRELDEQLAKLSRDIIRIRLAAGIPREEVRNDIPRQEIGLLRKEIGKKARHIPVRQLIGRIPTLLPRLKPCVLMSPLSVAQYLEASHETFDVVIFDEASQIPVWDAIGAIARGRQLIVVGDPKQLPPSNFFATNAADEDDLTPEEHKDLESILDELMTHGLRHKRLNWHYRSRHEGLITFSNRQYYENELLTFPSPEMEHGGVRFRYLPEARYDKGRSRTNRVEAAALVKELVSRLRNTNLPRRSYGVVTFSQAQQALVENLLDEERHKHPEIEHHFGENPPLEGEPVFVKNLENVQGDERDVILFSVCYGLDEAGKLSMNFGPLNRDGGERRLNVAATRAKHEVLVFSGLRGDQIDLTRTRARGVRDLKHFLQYADRGHEALIAATSNSHDAEADSEFERMVATRIRAAGYDVHHQVGCSGYRIDLAVVDPAAPGRYLLGVECDGATYHRAATARDRDKLRQAVLEDLGWTLHRIWSTDWWHNANSEMEKLLTAITSAIEARQLETADSVDQLVEEVTIQTPENSEASAPTAAPYTLTDFSSFSDRISADRFYSKEYDINLREMIGHVLETEGPISDTLLVNWIARAHALQRSGRIITERVLNLAKRHFHISQDPVGGTFIWRDKEAQATWSTYRTAGAEESMRNMEEISFEEIRAAILKNSSGDVPFEVARAFGIRRLASEGRSRIEAVMQNCSIENKKRRNS
jgi:very-short-patch-repair endonuclease